MTLLATETTHDGAMAPFATSSTRSMRSSRTSRALRGFARNGWRLHEPCLEGLRAMVWAGRASTRSNRDIHDLRGYLAISTVPSSATRTIAAHLSAVRSFFFDGPMQKASWKLMSPRWCRCQKMPRSLPKTVSSTEMQRLLAAPDSSTPSGMRDAAMLRSCSTQRARVCCELSHINIADFDWTTKTVRLFGKGSKERIVPVYRRALDATRTYIDDARPLLVRASSDSAAIKRVDGPLFLSTRGNRLDANALRYRFHKLCREAGLPADVTPHVMRHTFATDLLAGGADPRSIPRSFWAMQVFLPRRSTPTSHPIA